MSSSIPYSATQDDLFYPSKRGNFFPGGRPKSEAALCAEMSRLAYLRQESNFAFDQVGVRDVLRRIEFSDCEFFESKGKPDEEGIHCFLAQHLDSPKDERLAVLAFRGTDKDDPSDVAYDENFKLEPWQKGGKVHSGFAHAFAEIWKDLDPPLRRVDCKILFTGHSLGAAVATLAASLRRPNTLYTFGSPRVGNSDFIAACRDVNSQRYVDCCDIVTRIPLREMGYEHVGKAYYIDRKRRVTFDRNALWTGLDRIWAAKEYLLKYAWKLGNLAARELADHAPINYVWAVSADQP